MWSCEKFSGARNFNGNLSCISLLRLHLRFEHSLPSELRLFHYEIIRDSPLCYI